MRTKAPRRRGVVTVVRSWRESRRGREASQAEAIAEAVARGQADGATQAATYAGAMNSSRV